MKSRSMSLREHRKAMLRRDEAIVRRISEMESAGIVAGKPLEVLRGLRAQFHKYRCLSWGQRMLCTSIEAEFSDYKFWARCRDLLVQFYNDGQLHPKSCHFVESLITQFDIKHMWSELQREQVCQIIISHESAAEAVA